MRAKLLLADDSVTIQRVIELTFADEDIEVTAVGDGDAAIARLEASPPDIVLADVGMPGRDGYEVAAHVKRSLRLAHIPVLLLAGAVAGLGLLRPAWSLRGAAAVALAAGAAALTYAVAAAVDKWLGAHQETIRLAREGQRDPPAPDIMLG